MRTLSANAIASANAEHTDEVWLVCLTIRHAAIEPGGVIRLVNNTEDIVRTVDGFTVTYVGLPFIIDLPGEDPDQAVAARLQVDNVDRQIVQAVRNLDSPPLCDLEVILASSPDTVEVGFYDLTLRAATYDALYVEGELTIEQIFTEPVSLDMTPQRFPGMF